jgi:transposase
LTPKRRVPPELVEGLGAVLGLERVAEREVYAALDWLGGQQPRIEAGLARRHLRDGTLVLYDVSSSYFEGCKCPLARFGYSRDHRADRRQIVYGLLCTRDGLPIAVEVFDGNTADPATLGPQILKLKARFKLDRVVLVGDRGMITSARIRDDLKPAGLDWITCLRAPQIRALAAADGPLQPSLFDERDLAEITAPEEFPGERLMVCRNPLLAEERARKREDLLAATERDLSRIRLAVERQRAPLRGTAEIGIAVGAVLDKHKMAKHFEVKIGEASLTFRRKCESIAEEARLDGIYVVRTSVPAEAMMPAETVQAYKDLDRVERAFRNLKSVDLEIHPIRHWMPDRVRAHVFLCMLAYHVEWHLRQALAPLLFHDTEIAAARAERASPVRKAEPSPSAQAKKATRRNSDGQPIMAFADLMDHLGTLTRNVLAAPFRGSPSLILYASLTPLQEAAFERLDINPRRVQ